MKNLDHKIYGSVTVNTKGQIILPADLRKQMNIGEGDKLLITSKGDNFIGIIKVETLEGFINELQTKKSSIDADIQDLKSYKKK